MVFGVRDKEALALALLDTPAVLSYNSKILHMAAYPSG